MNSGIPQAAHIRMSHVSHMNESCLTYEWVMSHIWIQAFHRRLTYEWVMSHIWMSHVSHMNKSCRTLECQTSNMWMSHVAHMNESFHTYEYMCPCHVGLIETNKRRLGRGILDMTHSYVWHDSFICVTWLIHLCDTQKTSHTYDWFMSYIRRNHVTRTDETCPTYKWVM